jgi:hypothetical protein
VFVIYGGTLAKLAAVIAYLLKMNYEEYWEIMA